MQQPGAIGYVVINNDGKYSELAFKKMGVMYFHNDISQFNNK